MSSETRRIQGLLYGWAFLCFVVVSGVHPVALLLSGLGLLAYRWRGRWPGTRRRVVAGLGAALLGAGLASQAELHSGYLLGTGSLALAIFAAGCLLTFTLLTPTEATRLAIPGLSGLLLVTCGLSTELRIIAMVAAGATLLLALAFREQQGLRLSWRIIPHLVVVLALGSSLSLLAAWSETRLAFFLNMFAVVPASGVRFPPSAGLDSIQKWNGSDIVVLRIYGDASPSYLVGRTFSDFDERSFWHWKPTKEEVAPVGQVPSPLDPSRSWSLFQDLPDASPDLRSPLIVEFPDGGSGFTFFTPRNFAALSTDLERLHRYSDGLWQVLARDTFSGAYALYPSQGGWTAPPTAAPLSAEERARHLALPPDLTPEISRLAKEVAGRFRDPQEKAQRITTFFQTQFEYGYDYPFRSPEKALEEFLLQRPPAHCEFFATATALMLRAEGVPTRYLNGFVVQERSFDDSYYVVRLKHAHAWIEAYLPGQGWVTFDPTPPGALGDPTQPHPSSLQSLLEWASNSWRQMISWWRLSPTEMLYRLRAGLQALGWREGLAGLLLLGGWWGIQSWRRRRRNRLKKTAPGESYSPSRDPHLTPHLESLEKAIHPPEWSRRPWETPYQWIHRLAGSDLDPALHARLQTALQRYQAARFGATEDSSLGQELQQLRQALEGKSLQARERPRATE